MAAEKSLRQQLGMQGNGAQPMSAKAKKKAAAKARAAAAAQLAITAPSGILPIENGGVGDSLNLVGAYGKGKSKGKGKGDDTHNGVPICYNWNRGAPCRKGAGCTYAHVCLICKADHPKKDHK